MTFESIVYNQIAKYSSRLMIEVHFRDDIVLKPEYMLRWKNNIPPAKLKDHYWNYDVKVNGFKIPYNYSQVLDNLRDQLYNEFEIHISQLDEISTQKVVVSLTQVENAQV